MSGTKVEADLSPEASDLHRALSSLQEELEAVDYYNQRAENAKNPELKNLLLHNRNEEIEHAVMLTEWVRRRIPEMNEELRTYLFTEGPVTNLEAENSGSGSPTSLTIGSLKRSK